MNLSVNLLCSLVFCILLWQDFKWRMVTAWLVPAACILFLLGERSELDLSTLLFNFLFNSGVLVFQFSVYWLMHYVRHRRPVKIINGQIGTGDLLLLFCLAPAFSPVNYILFLVLSLTASLMVTILVREIRRGAWKEIPLAGLLAIPLLALSVIRMTGNGQLLLTDDSWLIYFLQPS